MRKQEQDPNVIKRAEKHKAEETERLNKELKRKEAYLLKEETLEKATKAKEIKRMEERAAEEIQQQAKEKARKEALVAREKAIAEDQEARKLKAEKQAQR